MRFRTKPLTLDCGSIRMPRPWLGLGIRVWRATSSRPWNIVTQPLCLSHVQPRSLFLHLTFFFLHHTLFLRVYGSWVYEHYAMDLLSGLRKGDSSRGGRAEFRWDDVKEDKDRENYLGHSLMARVFPLLFSAKGEKKKREKSAANSPRSCWSLAKGQRPNLVCQGRLGHRSHPRAAAPR